MKSGTIVEIIAKNYKNLTKTEAIVGDFFINNRVNGDFSSKYITNKLFISEATLSRFAQKCGFRGYREFLYKYQEVFIEKEDAISSNVEQALNSYHEILRQFVGVDDKVVERLVELMEGYEYILALGVGSSGLVAAEMRNRFMRLGLRMECVTDVDEMRMKSVLQDEKCLVIGLSLSGRKKEILFSLNKAKESGAATVLITSNRTAQYDYCDEVIVCPAFHDLAQGNMISPQFPLLVVVDICYNTYLSRHPHIQDKKQLHKKTVEVLKEI